jgi:hypothetical protein
MVYLSNNDWSRRGSYGLTVRYDFRKEILARNVNDDLPAKFTSSDEANFNINSTVNLYRIHVWATENLFAISKVIIYGPCSFLGEKKTFTCNSYPIMIILRLLLHLEVDSSDLTLEQDGVPLHFHRAVGNHPNAHLPQIWID